MREVIFYEARDGRSFKTSTARLKHERELDEVSAILDPIGPPPRNHNGDTYIQRGTEVRQMLINKLKATPYKHPRHADDSRSPYQEAWYRVMCMDETGREWGQPYFANHPNEKATPE